MSEPQVPKNSTCLYCGEEVDSLHEECQVVTLSFDTTPLTRSMLQAVRNKLDSIDGHGLSLGSDEALFEHMVEFCFFISVDPNESGLSAPKLGMTDEDLWENPIVKIMFDNNREAFEADKPPH